LLDTPRASGHGANDLARRAFVGDFRQHLTWPTQAAEPAYPQAIATREIYSLNR
jgi:hypothetical protein